AVARYPWFGVQGLAFSFSVAYAVAAVMALRSLARRTGGLGLDLKGRQVLARTTVAALVMTGAVRLAVVALPGRPPDLVEAAVGVLVGVVVYGAALSAMRVREVAEIVKGLRARAASPSRCSIPTWPATTGSAPGSAARRWPPPASPTPTSSPPTTPAATPRWPTSSWSWSTARPWPGSSRPRGSCRWPRPSTSRC